MQRLRRLHSKTRSGCITCRARHVKCDEKQPVCKRCEGRSEVCTYDTPRANISGSTCVSSSDTLSTGSGANTGPMDMSCTTGEKIVTMSQHQRRKGGVKAKSGCRPCKLRHLKCGEERPSCARCLRTNVLCTGFPSAPFGRAKAWTTQPDHKTQLESACQIDLALYSTRSVPSDVSIPLPISTPYRTSSEQMGLKYWLARATLCDDPDAARTAPTDFIGTQIPCVAWSNASLRHAIVAAGITCASLEQSVDRQELDSQICALQHSNRAIRGLVRDPVQTSTTALVAFVFYFTEIWSGRWDAAVGHLRHAVRLVVAKEKEREAVMKGTDFDNAVCKFIKLVCVCVPRALQNEEVLSVLADVDPRKQVELRLAYVLYHLERVDRWFEDAIERVELRNKEDSAKRVAMLLEVNRRQVWEICRLWRQRRRVPLLDVLDSKLRIDVLKDSPYERPMACFDLFLVKAADFSVFALEAQLKLTLRTLMIFAAGSDLAMRKDAVGVIRLGGKLKQTWPA